MYDECELVKTTTEGGTAAIVLMVKRVLFVGPALSVIAIR
jgi:hypothetical protein